MSWAQENPQTPGEYITPTLSTDIEPTITEGSWPVFTNGAWNDEEDNRGPVYDTTTGAMQQYNILGALPSTLTKTPPVVPNINGFLNGVANGLGDIIVANNFLVKYPAFTHAITASNWTDASKLLQDAVTTNTITQQQHDTIVTIASQNNITL